MKRRLIAGGKERLADEATRLKKAWLLAIALVGYRRVRGFSFRKQGHITNYDAWNRRDLQKEAADLLADFVQIMGSITPTKTRLQQQRAVNWMANQFDRWRSNGFGTMTMCTAQQFEEQVGRLNILQEMDIPPYAEMMLQGWEIDLAFRHPEYMLSRDLELLYNLTRDAEDLLESIDGTRPPEWAAVAGENAQALSRATIQACFNLLESFTSGLAHGFVMEHPNLDEGLKKKLLDNSESLQKRVVKIPKLIGDTSSGLDVSKPPMSELFGPIKQRRDAFVHCEPGPQESKRGYVKETAFHDATWVAVQQAVTLTLVIIERVWKSLHGKERPSWLPKLGPDGRPSRKNLRLSPDFPQIEADAEISK